MLINLLLILLSVAISSLPWYGTTSLGMFFMFVPLLLVQERTSGRGFTLYSLLFLLLWNLSTNWWIGYAAWIGVAASVLCTTILFFIPLALYNYIWKRATRPLAYTALVSGWIAMEYIYFNGEISWPWLVLGNGLSCEPWLVQWYQISGVMGGSFWILASNLLILNIIKRRYILRERVKGLAIVLAAWIVIPLVFSLYLYQKYDDDKECQSLNVAILQPNIDPYNEKFGGLTNAQQLKILLTEAAKAEPSTDLLLAPETALEGAYWHHTLGMNRNIAQVEELMERYPKAKFITGATSLELYRTDTPPTTTARKGEDYYYDVYNSAFMIDSKGVEDIYHKSKLVIGVEMVPYHRFLKYIPFLSVDLGGMAGMLASQPQATTFSLGDTTIGTAICYEGVYGEYFSQFVLKGAKAMTVISNDGWWDDTPGYHLLMAHSKLRAIECRRAIARSANTGISAFVNRRGDIVSSLEWDERGILQGELPLSSEITFYVVYGDVIGRVSLFTFILSILYYIAYNRKKKDYLYR